MLHRHASDRATAARVGLILGLAGLVLALRPAGAIAQVSPEESARRLKPAEGLEATLWASEPMLSNPTNIDVDSRGRVWVAEGLNYRLTRGGNKRFQRIEEADRIKILEDTDGDGKADKVTVFADQIFPVPMGIAVEEQYGKDGKYAGCRVYIGNSPDLLVLEDTDGDDKADKRYPLLTGFGGVDSDHGVHGMVLGLDGKLYFTHGDGCCSVQQDHSERPQNFDVVDKRGRHVSTDQLANTLRVNRDGTEFEIIGDRQRNNYETSLNSFGNVFTSDNDDDGNRGCRVIWVMDGGHYGYRTPGSPRHWGEEVPGNVPKLVGTGNGSPCGIMVYEGDLLADRIPRRRPRGRCRHAADQLLPDRPARGRVPDRLQGLPRQRRPVVPARRLTRRARWLGVRRRLVRRGRRRPRLQRPDHRADLPRRPKGHKSRRPQARLRHRRRPDRRAQVAGRRHAGRRAPRR